MSPHLQSLRVDCDAIRKGGYRIDVEPPEHIEPRGINMPNITKAVAEYQSIPAPKPWGSLSRCAESNHTTPSSILGRINRKAKKL